MLRSGGGTPNVSAAVGTLPVANGGTAATTALEAARNLGVPYKLAQWNVATYIAPTGSMANNGAVTLGTALDRTYTEGLWLHYPAGAVAAGVPAAAAWLWTVMSSSTLGTVYNSTWDGLSVPTVGVTTAYVTTGPGAYAGVTSITTAITIAIAANTLGATGQIFCDFSISQNNGAGNKTYGALFNGTGGTDYGFITTTQNFTGFSSLRIRNQAAAVQTGQSISMFNATNPLTTGLKASTADTTGATTLVFRYTNATATNWMGIAGGNCWVVPA